MKTPTPINVIVAVETRPTPGGFAADITTHPQPAPIKGCPMGRGATPDAAIADLQRRVLHESNVNLAVGAIPTVPLTTICCEDMAYASLSYVAADSTPPPGLSRIGYQLSTDPSPSAWSLTWRLFDIPTLWITCDPQGMSGENLVYWMEGHVREIHGEDAEIADMWCEFETPTPEVCHG
jgi:hypothetical protein